MSTPGQPQGRDWREWRRLRAYELKQQGWWQRDIARALGVTEGAVSQWLSRAARGGREALRHRPPPGPTPKLTAAQQAALLTLLERGAEHYGFVGEVWTGPRVATLIERHFGVRYHPSYVPTLLAQLGWTRQKPTRRASQRDEAAIAQWQTERWPALKKKPSARSVRSSG